MSYLIPIRVRSDLLVRIDYIFSTLGWGITWTIGFDNETLKILVMYLELKVQEFEIHLTWLLSSANWKAINHSGSIDWQLNIVFKGFWKYVWHTKDRSALDSELVISTQGLRQKLRMIYQIADWSNLNWLARPLVVERFKEKMWLLAELKWDQI